MKYIQSMRYAILVLLTLFFAISCNDRENNNDKNEDQADADTVSSVEDVYFTNLFHTETLSAEEINARKRQLYIICLIAWSMGEPEGAVQNQARMLLNDHSSPSEIRDFITELRKSTDKVYINNDATYLQTKENTVIFIVMCESNSLAALIEKLDPDPLLGEFIDYIFDN